MTRARWVVAAAAVLVAGCGTTEKTGAVGDTLESRTLHGTVHRYVPEVKRRIRNDVTGLSSPGAGNHFAAVDMELCRDEEGQAVNSYAFQLELDGGDRLRPRSPQRVYDDGFEVSRAGCERGWLVYAVPDGETPAAVILEYDDTGQAIPGRDRQEHVDFTWEL